MKINYNWSAHNFRLKPSAMSFSYILLVNVMVSKKKGMPYIVLPSLSFDLTVTSNRPNPTLLCL